MEETGLGTVTIGSYSSCSCREWELPSGWRGWTGVEAAGPLPCPHLTPPAWALACLLVSQAPREAAPGPRLPLQEGCLPLPHGTPRGCPGRAEGR